LVLASSLARHSLRLGRRCCERRLTVVGDTPTLVAICLPGTFEHPGNPDFGNGAART